MTPILRGGFRSAGSYINHHSPLPGSLSPMGGGGGGGWGEVGQIKYHIKAGLGGGGVVRGVLSPESRDQLRSARQIRIGTATAGVLVR